jgi:hypothetical protein
MRVGTRSDDNVLVMTVTSFDVLVALVMLAAIVVIVVGAPMVSTANMARRR